MVNMRKKVIIYIVLKIVLILIIIGLNYILPNFENKTIIEDSSAGIIGGADVPTAIYISTGYGFSLKDILIYSLSILLMINIIILLVYNIIELKQLKIFDIKYKFKTIITIDLFIILSIIIQIVFILFGLIISVVLNITLLSLLFTKIYFKRIVKQKENNKTIE